MGPAYRAGRLPEVHHRPVMYSITGTITVSKKIESNHLRTFLDSATSFLTVARDAKVYLMALQSSPDHWSLVRAASLSEDPLHFYEPISCFWGVLSQSDNAVISLHTRPQMQMIFREK